MNVSECRKALCGRQLASLHCGLRCLPTSATQRDLEEAACLAPVAPLAFSAAYLFLPSRDGKNLPKYLLGNVL